MGALKHGLFTATPKQDVAINFEEILLSKYTVFVQELSRSNKYGE